MKALLVIDVQIGLVSGAYKENEVIAAINKASTVVRAAKGVVIYIRHCHKSYPPLQKDADTWQLDPRLDVKKEDIKLDKTASDAFYKTELAATLEAANVTELMISGLQTEYCVDASCRAALSREYNVVLLADGHTTGDALLKAEQTIEHHNLILSNLAHPTHAITLVSSTDL